ncbi:hypothetical protein HXY32_01400 [Candidatus Bathyarchaeota archaeon]|nr:hypothetical protein [Candidatus Bathyarchaeota archaeon]
MYRLDYMIHGDLYYYGLQSSSNWLLPMWTLERLIGICLILPMVFSSAILIWDLRISRKQKPTVKCVELPAPQPQQQQKPTSAQMLSSNNRVKAQVLQANSMVISCPNCKKVFSKPLIMLDFSGKQTKLVNVCPYCNEVLGTASDNEGKADVKVGVLDSNEKIENRR